jgi:uncharacterized protein YggE
MTGSAKRPRGLRSIGVGVAAGLLGATLGLSIPSAAQTPWEGGADRTVTVSGSATVRAMPDEAVVSLGVQTEAEDADAAMNQNATRMAAVIRAILDAGVPREDVATTNVSLYPSYGSDGTAVTGYVAGNQVDATVRDLRDVGRLIDSAVDAGANSVNGIAFGLSDDSEGLDEALRGAVDDARDKAEVLADAAGSGLGRVVSITETASGFPPPVYYDEAAAADGGATPVIPPEVETQVSVTVTWSLS